MTVLATSLFTSIVSKRGVSSAISTLFNATDKTLGFSLKGPDVTPSQQRSKSSQAGPENAPVWVVPFPKLSHTMSEGRLTKWHKKAGERVNMYDVLFELSTEELTEEVFKVGDFAGEVRLLVEAQEEGWLATTYHPADETKPIKVGTPVAVMCEDEKDVAVVQQSYSCPTTDVYDDTQPQVPILTWQSFLKSGSRNVKCMG